ncbi:MAG: exodeoxyribonuclease VII large subunit [Pseudomonadota bacterium]
MSAPVPVDDAGTNDAAYTVSELSRSVKRTVEDGFSHVRVRGEIGGFRGRHSSGHGYFSLKDENAAIDAVVWRSAWAKLGVKPEEGLEVIATGRLTTFAKKSSYQIVVEQLEPAGLGALMKLLEERRKKLAAEGLFDEARKRPLPVLPGVIGVVTSPTGAVIRDILHRVSDRFPRHVVVWPVRVQGETSAAEVTAAVTGFATYGGPRPDVIIVARGGGSVEDLWGFNDEALVRAVAASPIPIISAVGHETDWTLIDHAADLRAPTPTGAAERAVPVRRDAMATLSDRARRLTLSVDGGLDRRQSALRLLARALPDGERLLGPLAQRVDAAADRAASALLRRTTLAAERMARAGGRLSHQHLAALVDGKAARLEALAHRLSRAAERGRAERAAALAALSSRTAPAAHNALHRKADRAGALGRRLSVRLLSRTLSVEADRLARTGDRLARGGDQRLLRADAALKAVRLDGRRLDGELAALEARAARAGGRLQTTFLVSVTAREKALRTATKMLDAVSYRRVLDRGFALIHRAEGGAVKRAGDVVAGDALAVEFADGRIAATAGGDAPAKPRTAAKAAPRPTRRSSRVDDRQGSLF